MLIHLNDIDEKMLNEEFSYARCLVQAGKMDFDYGRCNGDCYKCNNPLTIERWLELKKKEFGKCLNKDEFIELSYLYKIGFRYISRNEDGTLMAFKKLPVRNHVVNGIKPGMPVSDTWIIGKYPITDCSLYYGLKIGKYKFVKWADEPFKIKDLLQM